MEEIETDTTPEEGQVLVGAKPPMNYVQAVLRHFHAGASRVVLKARGRAISRCVDVAEIVRNGFLPDVTVADIRIGTEEVVNERGRETKVSSIEIELGKP